MLDHQGPEVLLLLEPEEFSHPEPAVSQSFRSLAMKRVSKCRRNAEKIAKACNVSVDYILGEDGNDEFILSEDEMGLIEEYRALAPKGKNRVRMYVCEMGIVYGLREDRPAEAE